MASDSSRSRAGAAAAGAEPAGAARIGAGLARNVEAQFADDDLLGNHLLRIERGEAAHEILQLADIARPAIALHALQRRRLQRFQRQALARRLGEEMAGEIADVFGALAQRRQAQRHDIEAEEQVLAEQALLDEDAQVLVGRRDDADIGLDRGAAADGGVFALLEHAQKPGLGVHRHVADLVEKERAALRLLETPDRALAGAGEGALLVAEQFAFDQVARNGRDIDRRRKGPFLRLP